MCLRVCVCVCVYERDAIDLLKCRGLEEHLLWGCGGFTPISEPEEDGGRLGEEGMGGGLPVQANGPRTGSPLRRSQGVT